MFSVFLSHCYMKMSNNPAKYEVLIKQYLGHIVESQINKQNCVIPSWILVRIWKNKLQDDELRFECLNARGNIDCVFLL